MLVKCAGYICDERRKRFCYVCAHATCHLSPRNAARSRRTSRRCDARVTRLLGTHQIEDTRAPSHLYIYTHSHLAKSRVSAAPRMMIISWDSAYANSAFCLAVYSARTKQRNDVTTTRTRAGLSTSFREYTRRLKKKNKIATKVFVRVLNGKCLMRVDAATY